MRRAAFTSSKSTTESCGDDERRTNDVGGREEDGREEIGRDDGGLDVGRFEEGGRWLPVVTESHRKTWRASAASDVWPCGEFQ